MEDTSSGSIGSARLRERELRNKLFDKGEANHRESRLDLISCHHIDTDAPAVWSSTGQGALDERRALWA